MITSAEKSTRRRAARVGSGQALFGALGATIRLLRWLLLGLAGIYLCSGITRVEPNEDALIYRFGKLQRDVHPPGLCFALPPPIDRVVTKPEAEGDAFRTRQQASADARELVARARGEATSFLALLAEHRAAPALVEARLRNETIEQILPRVKTQTLLPDGRGQLNVFLRDK